MQDWQKLQADYLLNKLYNYLLSLQDTFLQQNELIYLLSAIFTVFVLITVIRKFLIIKNSLKEQSMLLELTPPSFTEQESYTTDQLFSIIHAIGSQRSFKDRVLGNKTRFSLEIVSTKSEGIRYIVRTSPKHVNTLKKSLLSYLPHLKVKTVNEYLPENSDNLEKYSYRILEFKLSKHFAFALKRQSELDRYDPIAYITGMMTKLQPSELISLQMVLTPIKNKGTRKILNLISSNGDVIKYLKTPGFLKWIFYNSYRAPHTKSPSEIEVVNSIDTKINQPMFKTSIRLLMVFRDKDELQEREQGFKSAFSAFSFNGYQSLTAKRYLNINKVKKHLFFVFKKRLQSFTKTSILSISEVSGIYHFPYTKMANTENIVKSHSKELPAPLSLKQGNNLDILFAKNTYGGSTTMIGLTKEERMRHMYILGATGTGKSTLLLSQISQDIKNGKGVCLIDPHGDLAKAVLNTVPKEREKDVVYINPFDIKHPVSINLLEYTSIHHDQDDVELENDFISESVVSIFRKIFSNEFTSGSAHRIEYVLRNTIQTALVLKKRNLFTIYDLLNDPDFRKNALTHIKDDRLLKFWKNELGKAGSFQQVKMTAPITARIGRFLFSPIAKRILDHQKSSINFDEVLDNGKILICNLSKGNLGEDTSQVIGILILAKIQLAILKRARLEAENRKTFFLYVDEFQNFATKSFVDMMAESRKYGLNITIAEQSSSQQNDRNLTNVILANTGTVICFKTANPEDEKLILPQFKPYIQSGEIGNLPAFHFYMKNAAIDPQEPFSGETILVDIKQDKERVERITQLSRDKYSVKYVPSKIKPEEESVDQKSSQVPIPNIKSLT